MTTDNKTIDFVTFTIIIDDIVFPDGRTEMGLLGGSGPQTAFGMRLWTKKVGLVAGVGPDLPPDSKDWFAAFDIDTEGLLYTDRWPTPRAWQAMEEDGRRTQVWRVPGPAIAHQLRHQTAQLPPSYQPAKAFHLGIHPGDADLNFIHALRKQGAVVSLETFRPADQPLSQTELQQVASAGQIISPNLLEARSMLGPGQPMALVRQLAQAGAQIVALRLGADGVLVYRADTGESWQVPAVETEAVDPVGAGNAFCGGFLVGWVETGNLLTAALYGVVAASFLVEVVGVPAYRPTIWAEAQARLEAVSEKMAR